MATLSQKFGLTNERGIRIWSEFLVYAWQRCLCGNRCMCIKETKSLNLLEYWPGSSLTDTEKLYLYYIASKATMHSNLIATLNEIEPLDLSMGAEYCIQFIEKKCHEAEEYLRIMEQSALN